VVTTEDEYGEDGIDAIKNAATHYGIDIAIERKVAGDGGGILTIVQEIASCEPQEASDPLTQPTPDQVGPSAVVIWGLGNATADVAESLREAGYDGPLFLDPSAA